MAVTYDSVGAFVSGNSATRDASITVGTGSDRLLVAFVTRHAGSASADSVEITVGGSGSFTFLGKQALPADGMIEIWYLVNPPSGALTVRSTLPSAPGNEHGLILLSFAGVDQATPMDAFTNGTNLGAFGTVASSANNMVVCGLSCAINGTITNGTTVYTDVWQQYSDFAYSVGSAAFQWTFSGGGGGNDGIVAANINAVAAATAARGTPFGTRGTAFNGGRTFHGIIR